MSIQDLVAGIDVNMKFDVEIALENQLGIQPLPFEGMDKTGAGVCIYFLNGTCGLGNKCPFRHLAGEKSVVCKHWLRGLCKKGDQCEFLHEYDLTRMPECYFFSKYNACSNKECPFRHIDPESKKRDCAWYDRGFCRNGPHCKNRHRRRVMCPHYLNGFCKDGKSNCKFTHPSFDIPLPDPVVMQQRRLNQSQIVCHNCHEKGHKASFCPNLPPGSRPQQRSGMPIEASMYEGGIVPVNKALDDVTCYKCGEKGHYANRCTKGALAFLSQSAHLTQEIRQREQITIPTVRYNAPFHSRPRAGEMMR